MLVFIFLNLNIHSFLYLPYNSNFSIDTLLVIIESIIDIVVAVMKIDITLIKPLPKPILSQRH